MLGYTGQKGRKARGVTFSDQVSVENSKEQTVLGNSKALPRSDIDPTMSLPRHENKKTGKCCLSLWLNRSKNP